MQRRTLWMLVVLVVLSLTLAACGSDSDTPDSGAQPEAQNTQEPQATPEQAETSSPIGESVAALLPGAPAPVGGDFRADPAQVVAATGRPQLLEFFTYW